MVDGALRVPSMGADIWEYGAIRHAVFRAPSGGNEWSWTDKFVIVEDDEAEEMGVSKDHTLGDIDEEEEGSLRPPLDGLMPG